MYRVGTTVLLSASDIVSHLACEHLTVLDRLDLDARSPRAPADDHTLLLQRKGDAWEHAYLERLRTTAHPDLVSLPADLRGDAAFEATRAAMARGVSLIYQGTLQSPGYMGRADFLRRVSGRSRFGDHAYEVLDTKLSRTPKASHVLQLCFYSWLAGEVGGFEPQYMHVVLGDGREVAFRYADYARYFHRSRARVAAAIADPRTDTYPHPCERCDFCHWRERCERRRADDDHLCQVAGITRPQIARLTAAGITTVAALAGCEPARAVPRLAADTFRKLQKQAAVHVRGRSAGTPVHEMQPLVAERGFAKLPPPCAGDLYFDMEGDPLYEGGLEYLFGVTYRDGDATRFRAFWAHDATGEKRAFEQFIDWLTARREQWPDFHVYHYASYENTALKRLMSLHGTREAEVDTLLRERRLVDLYRVVLESLVASTPSYSLKEIEHFYRGRRDGEVATAGASVVWYEKWRETREQKLLDDIERYNRDDCESTLQLHEWLLRIRPPAAQFREPGPVAHVENDSDADDAADAKQAAARAEREALKSALVAGLPADEAGWTAEQAARQLAAHLVDFHQRCNKPGWWKIYAAADASMDELVEDAECIGGLRRVGSEKQKRGRLPIWTCEYPEQDFKWDAGTRCTRADTGAVVTIESVDRTRRTLRLKPSTKALQPDVEPFALGPPSPFGAHALRTAVQRFGAAWVAGQSRHLALRAILARSAPRVRGRAPGTPLARTTPADLPATLDAIANLDESYLFVQGPPGAGKTYTGSHVILALLRDGKRVAISSNSHKAINHLLAEVAKLAAHERYPLRAAKKCDEKDEEQHCHAPGVTNESKPEAALDARYELVGGTAWLLAHEHAEAAFDYLFVDEAGQVSLGHLVAMGVAARNIVLLGDQMQLPQPIQGVHPGRSGESVLDYLLEGRATVEPSRGVFLARTWRMHPDVCRFISDAVYDSQLQSAPECERRGLVIEAATHPAVRATGLRFWAVPHEGNRQASAEEARAVREIYDSLLGLSWRDHEGRIRPMSVRDVLVVAPYNMQVNLLRGLLPEGARVGTVDKFQGQEAPVVIASLATSSGDCLPRDVGFLYSKHRLNVAISRAQCLAIVVASPKLLDVPCRTAEEIALVNTLCWVADYASN